jgi:hypothetical protein
VGAAALGLFDHRHGHLAEALRHLGILGQQLHEPVGAGQAGRPAADDRHADVDLLGGVVELALDELGAGVDRRPVVDRRGALRHGISGPCAPSPRR